MKNSSEQVNTPRCHNNIVGLINVSITHFVQPLQLRLLYYFSIFKDLKFLFITIYSLLFISSSFSTNYSQRQSGSWNDPNTWTTSIRALGGGWQPIVNTATYPQAGDNVYFENNGNLATITLTADAQCANLYFKGSEPACVIAIGNYNLTITGTWTVDWSSNATFTQGFGYLQVNGGIPLFNVEKTISNFRVGSSSFSFTQTNSIVLIVSSNYDYNCYQQSVPTGVNASAATKRNATPCSPVLSLTNLSSFGSVCQNTTAGPNSFIISGLALTNANILVGALPGFSYSTSVGGTYTSSLSLSQAGGNYSQTIYVKFSPIYAISYNGNIIVGGGGATNVTVPAVGTGSPTVLPVVNTPTATNITSTTVSLGGTMIIDGCTSQNSVERGIYYSTTSGFADGTGTKVSETGVFGTGAFSLNVTGLTPSTTYYYKAYATNSLGAGYSAQGSFNNTPRDLYYVNGGGSWSSVSNWRVGSCTGTTATSLPTSADNVFITCGWGGNPVIMDMNGYCKNLTIDQMVELRLNGYTLSVSGNVNVASSNQGVLNVGNGVLNVAGSLTINRNNGAIFNWDSGTITINGNLTDTGGYGTLGGTQTGFVVFNGLTLTIGSNISIPNLKQSSASFTKAGAYTLTVATVFDRSCGPAPTISAGVFTVTGSTINTTCNPTKIFRSQTSGNWSNVTTWQQSTDGGSNWITATSVPINTDGLVTIQSGHTVTLTSAAGASSLTVNGSLNLSTFTLSGSGSLILASGGIMLVGGTSNFPTGFSMISLNTGCTVSYFNTGDQTVSPRSYDNLTLSGSGVKTTAGVAVMGILSIEGSATATGNILANVSNTTLQFNGSTAQNIGNNFFQGNKTYNMIISNPSGVNLNTDFTVNQNLTVNSGAFITIQPAQKLLVGGIVSNLAGNSGIIIKASSSLPNGSFVFNNIESNAVNGTVEMYSKAFKAVSPDAFNCYYKWQYFGIPVKTLTASPTFNGSYLRSYVESGDLSNHWINMDLSSALQPFYGYEITQQDAKTIVFQGQLVNWSWTTPVLDLTVGAAYSGQHILANPFTSAIGIKDIVFGSDMVPAVYLYSTGSYGDWATVTGISTGAGQWEVSTPSTAGISGVASQIPSMQAIMVQVNVMSSNATVTFPYGAIVKNTDLQRSKRTLEPSEEVPTSGADKVCLRIDVAGSKTSDRMWLFADSICTRKFDKGWDGVKIMGSIRSPQLYASEIDNNYQIDCVNDMNNTILGFHAGEDSIYTMTFTTTNTEKKYAGVYLVDLAENKLIDINGIETTYTFNSHSNESGSNRFKIITRLPEIDLDDVTTSKIKLFNSGNIIYLENLSNQKGELGIYDLVGHCLKKINFGANEIISTQLEFRVGAYVLHAIAGNEKTGKIFLKR